MGKFAFIQKGTDPFNAMLPVLFPAAITGTLYAAKLYAAHVEPERRYNPQPIPRNVMGDLNIHISYGSHID
jgi:hypothetical protein